MPANVWERYIIPQHDAATEGDVDAMRDGLVEPFEDFWRESREGTGIPLSYHTKTCAWASDYPLFYRRVLVYLNPSEGHLGSLPFEDYVAAEFGCRPDTFVDLVADGWIIPMLTERERYSDTSAAKINRFFEEVNAATREERWPRYVHIPDRTLGAAMLDDGDGSLPYATTSDGESVDVEATVDRLMGHPPWTSLSREPITVPRVKHSDLRRYVLKRYVKLMLASDALDTTDPTPIVDAAASHDPSNREETAYRVYNEWNRQGAPVYYCDLSGAVDIGPGPAKWYASDIASRLDKAKKGISEQTKRFKSEWVGSQKLELIKPNDVDQEQLFSCAPSAKQAVTDERLDTHADYYDAVRNTLLGIRDLADSHESAVRQHNAAVDAGTTSLLGRNAQGRARLARSLAGSAASFLVPDGMMEIASMTIEHVVGNREQMDVGVPKSFELDPGAELCRADCWSVEYDGMPHVEGQRVATETVE